MINKLNRLISEARKNKETFRIKCLSLVKAEIIVNSKAKKIQKDESVVLSYLKKLEKNSHYYEDTDIWEDILKEVEIVKELVPKMLSNEEVKVKVEEYFSVITDNVKPGIAIKDLKVTLGEHNSSLIAKNVMLHLKRLM